MSDLPPFPRDMLAAAFNGNQRMIGAFERLIAALTETVAKAESGNAAAGALDAAAIVLAVANSAFPSAKVLAEGEGITLLDGGDILTISASDLIPRIEGSYPVHFIVTADTNLILPTSGQVATLNDLQTLVTGAVTSFNTRTGAVTLTSGDVTGALGYTPTSVTGLTGSQSAAAFKTGLSLVKADVGLGDADNTADDAKNVLSATKLTTGRNISLTGDGAWTVSFDGSGDVTAALTLATVNANVGSFGSATKASTFTADAKGRLIAAGEVTITPAVGSITGLGTGVATALAVNVGSAGAFVTFNGALGTPSSGTLTNCTFPTLNQNTTGSAAKWTTARNLAGNSVDGSANVAFANKFIVQGTADSGLSAAQFLGALGTGIVKNTTTTGVLSIAVAADFPTLNQNTTGSAATLTTPRNFSISGGGITAAAVSFNGSAAVALSASVDAGHITLARMANLAPNSFIGNNTGSAATPVALTAAQAKTLLAIASTDVSGLGTAATKNTGTSGSTVPLLDGTNTWTNAQTVGTGAAMITNILNGSATAGAAIKIQRNGSDASFFGDTASALGSGSGFIIYTYGASDMVSFYPGGSHVLDIGTSLGNYANDAAAAVGGVAVAQMYRNGSALMIRVA